MNQYTTRQTLGFDLELHSQSWPLNRVLTQCMTIGVWLSAM